MFKGQSGGSHGIFDGRFAGYWNTGKGSTWEGGVREAAFAYWKGTIPPGGRSAEVVSSLDVFPTFSALARLPLPAGVVYDGRDMSDVLLTDGGRSRHDVVFIYSQDPPPDRGPAAARMGRWKAHWSTMPGLGGCSAPACTKVVYPVGAPLLFDVEADPSEAYPLSFPKGTDVSPAAGRSRLPGAAGQGLPCGPGYATPAEIAAAIVRLVAARVAEMATFPSKPTLVAPPDLSGEAPGMYGVCCDRDPYASAPNTSATCNCTVY